MISLSYGTYNLFFVPSVSTVSTSSNCSPMTRSTAYPLRKCPRTRAMIFRRGSTRERTWTVPTAAEGRRGVKVENVSGASTVTW
jgi:hypothetical protein